LKLAKVVKTPAERRRYMIDYRQWLDTNETLTNTQFILQPNSDGGVAVDESRIVGNNQVVVYISGGELGVTYEILIRVTTSAGQVKDDTLSVQVKGA
jgi:hypothetical protein